MTSPPIGHLSELHGSAAGSARRCQGSREGEAQARRTTRYETEQILYSVNLDSHT